MATDKKHDTTKPSTPAPATAVPATAAPAATQDTSDPWADYSSLVEATKTRSGFPLLRSLFGETVFVTDLVQDEATKAYIVTLANVNTDKASKDFGAIISERGKYVVPPTYAKKLAAALKARRPDQAGIRLRLTEQKRGLGLS